MKKVLRGNVSSVISSQIHLEPSSDQFVAFCGHVIGVLDQAKESQSRLIGARTASQADKARTARNVEIVTASPADKARTARNHATASGVDARTTVGQDETSSTEAVSYFSPGRLSRTPSPWRLSSVEPAMGSLQDSNLQRFKVVTEDVSKYKKILEVFSPPRVSVAAKRAGFATTEPSNFDIKTGWNFFDAGHRANFWKVMREQKPDCVLMTPECRPFSTMMESNCDRMDEEARRKMQAEGMAMLHFCIQVAEFQLANGKEFSIEQPGRETHAMQWLLHQTGVIRFLFDQCMTGLVLKEGQPSRKTTALVTNHLGLAAVFSTLQCSQDHEHVRVEHGLPQRAAVFGPQLVDTFVRGLSFSSEAAFFGEEDEEDLEASLDAEIESSGRSFRRPATRTPSVNLQDKLTSDQKKKINQVHANLGHISRQQMLSLFKAAGAKDNVMRYVKDEFSCEQRMKQKKPIERKKASMPGLLPSIGK